MKYNLVTATIIPIDATIKKTGEPVKVYKLKKENWWAEHPKREGVPEHGLRKFKEEQLIF